MSTQSSFPYDDSMSTTPLRRPSTLAADKFRAAQRPLGASLEPRPAPRSEGAPVSAARTLYGTGSSPRPRSDAPSRPAAEAAPRRPVASRTTTATATRAERDGVLVTSIVVVFVMLTTVIAGLKVNGSIRQDRSRTAIDGTLSHVYEQQSAFRILNQRFATWQELQSRGLRMPTEQRVVASNASPSHWFMAVRDYNTGIVCSRTGELLDESPLERKPTCSDGVP